MSHMGDIGTDGLTSGQRKYRKNRERSKILTAQWRRRNPERQRELNKASHQRNAANRLAQKKEYYQRVVKQVSKSEPWLVKDRIRKALRRASGTLTPQEWADIRATQNDRCFWCKEAKKLEIDHRIPVSRGGLTNKDNVVGACKSCNSSRGNRHEIPPRLEVA